MSCSVEIVGWRGESCSLKLCNIEQSVLGWSYPICNRQQSRGVEVGGGMLTRWSRCSGCRKSAAWRTWLWICGSSPRGRFFASKRLCERTCSLRPRWTTRLNSHQPCSPKRQSLPELSSVALKSFSVRSDAQGWERSGGLHQRHCTYCLSWGLPLLHWQLCTPSTSTVGREIPHPAFPFKVKVAVFTCLCWRRKVYLCSLKIVWSVPISRGLDSSHNTQTWVRLESQTSLLSDSSKS